MGTAASSEHSSARNRRPASLVRRVAHPAWRRFFRGPWRGRNPARPQRRGPHQHLARDPGTDRYTQRLGQDRRPRNDRHGAAPRSRTWVSATAPKNAGSLHPFRRRRTCYCRPSRHVRPGHVVGRNLRPVPQPEGAPTESGHPAFRRRAADAGGRPHPAGRRAPAPPRRNVRRPGAGHRADAGRDHHAERQGYTIIMVEQNFRFAAPLADRFYVLEHGQVIQEFTQAELPSRLERLHEYLGV